MSDYYAKMVEIAEEASANDEDKEFICALCLMAAVFCLEREDEKASLSRTISLITEIFNDNIHINQIEADTSVVH